ncbi:hypothetical protein, partial [Franconibacter pulveris]|uniref:hypothetical protein n=1 Tax=Franconibacter pulveris TaxID=435910 RepID=UPI001F255395
RSADGSVGSPHARVGNCQASNKAKNPVIRPGFCYLAFNSFRNYLEFRSLFTLSKLFLLFIHLCATSHLLQDRVN